MLDIYNFISSVLHYNLMPLTYFTFLMLALRLGLSCFCPGWRLVFMKDVWSLLLTMLWLRFTLTATITQNVSSGKISIMTVKWWANIVRNVTLIWHVYLMKEDSVTMNSLM